MVYLFLSTLPNETTILIYTSNMPKIMHSIPQWTQEICTWYDTKLFLYVVVIILSVALYNVLEVPLLLETVCMMFTKPTKGRRRKKTGGKCDPVPSWPTPPQLWPKLGEIFSAFFVCFYNIWQTMKHIVVIFLACFRPRLKSILIFKVIVTISLCQLLRYRR